MRFQYGHAARGRILAVHSRKKTSKLYTSGQTPVLTTSRVQYARLRGSIRHIHPHKCAAGRDAVRIAESQREQLPIRIPPSCFRSSSSFRSKNRWPRLMRTVPKSLRTLPQNCSSNQ